MDEIGQKQVESFHKLFYPFKEWFDANIPVCEERGIINGKLQEALMWTVKAIQEAYAKRLATQEVHEDSRVEE
jgi:hypothetical protein